MSSDPNITFIKIKPIIYCIVGFWSTLPVTKCNSFTLLCVTETLLCFGPPHILHLQDSPLGGSLFPMKTLKSSCMEVKGECYWFT